MNTIDDMLENAPTVPADSSQAAAAVFASGPAPMNEPENAIPPVILPKGLNTKIILCREPGVTVEFDRVAVGRLVRAIFELAAPLCIVCRGEYADAELFSLRNAWRVKPWTANWDYGTVSVWKPSKQIEDTLACLRRDELPEMVGEALRSLVGNALNFCEAEARTDVLSIAASCRGEFMKIPCAKKQLSFRELFPTNRDISEYGVDYRAGDLGVTTTWVSSDCLRHLLQSVSGEAWRILRAADVMTAYGSLRSCSRCVFPLAWRKKISQMALSIACEMENLPEYRFYHYQRYFGAELEEIDWLWSERKKLLRESAR